MGQRRVREHAVRDQPGARAAVAAGKIVFDDPEVVDRGVRELWGPGAFADGPDVRHARLEPIVHTHVAPSVELDAGLIEADPGRVGRAAYGDEDVATFDPSLPGRGAHQDRDVLARATVHAEYLGRDQTLDALGAQHPLHLTGDVVVLPGEQLRAILDDRQATAEATVRLAEFEAYISSADHDQVWWYVVEFQRFDAGERAGGFQAGHVGHRAVGTDVDEDLVALEDTRPAVVQAHLECFRTHETARPHDQLGAAVLVGVQMRVDLSVDHVALALANLHHVDRDAIRRRPELRGMAREVRDVRAPYLVLARHAVDVRARPADPLALHDRRALARSRQIPGQQLSALSTAEHERVVPFWCSHTFPPAESCFKCQSSDGRVSTSVPAGLSIFMNAESRLRSRVPVSAALKTRARGIDIRRPTKELDQSAPAPQYMRCRGDRIRIREVRTVRFHW